MAATACIQKSIEDEPHWVQGPCTISRSPVAHPGDGESALPSCAILSDKGN